MFNNIFCVPKRWLMFMAGIVWMVVGYDIARMGLITRFHVHIYWYHMLFALCIFVIFFRRFFKMVRRHRRRILNYKEEYRPFWNLLDVRGYLVTIIILLGGIIIRDNGLLPDIFVACFYIGFGFALIYAGMMFIFTYISSIRRQKKYS